MKSIVETRIDLPLYYRHQANIEYSYLFANQKLVPEASSTVNLKVSRLPRVARQDTVLPERTHAGDFSTTTKFEISQLDKKQQQREKETIKGE